MVVGGFELPTAFVQLYEAIQRGEAPYMLHLQGGVDAYGHPWTSYGLNLFRDRDVIAGQTRDMKRKFREQGLLAYFGGCRPPISVEADHPFQLMATTGFSRSRPLLSLQADHPFR